LPLGLGVLLLALASGCGGKSAPGVHRLHADAAMVVLDRLYLKEIGRFGIRWWNSASDLETAIDYSAKTGSPTYRYMIGNTFDLNSSEKFLNDYYDDEGWWGLAWLKAYDLTKDARYLSASRTIFDDMASGWDDTCGGGVWWRKERDYKNAIPNELFLQLAARLYRRANDQMYLDWANRTWNWFSASGMINSDSQVNDGLTKGCANNGQTPWTYNQGVILGGLVELYEITKDTSLLDRAHAIAGAAVTKLVTADGILHETCEPDCGTDGPQFKGIFMRNLSRLHEVSPKQMYRDFILKNVDSIWTRARSDKDELGLVWSGPFDLVDPYRQGSAIDALNAALAFDSL
jgi:predicted alpha-1,6-mannanase (GH76 family)